MSDTEMLTPGLRRRLAQVELRYDELGKLMSDPATTSDPNRIRDVGRELSSLTPIVETLRELRAAEARLKEAQELIESDDGDLRDLAREEQATAASQVDELVATLRTQLVPRDPLDEKNVIVEIRAGEGGEEAALFAADLYRMYTRYAERKRWKTEILSQSDSEKGGFKEIVFRVAGRGAYSRLKFESGVVRVQRVPATEAQGRIHTSTATVAVLPEAEDVDLELKPEELRIEVSRAGGPGGQGVNTTDSAVQVLHIPTGTIVRCQDGRSQIKNKERALSILRARLLERKQREEAEKYSAQRRGQIGTGGREEKIRTYNFPQNRVTDHRIGLTLYNLDRVVDGDLGELIKALQAADVAERLKESTLPV